MPADRAVELEVMSIDAGVATFARIAYQRYDRGEPNGGTAFLTAIRAELQRCIAAARDEGRREGMDLQAAALKVLDLDERTRGYVGERFGGQVLPASPEYAELRAAVAAFGKPAAAPAPVGESA